MLIVPPTVYQSAGLVEIMLKDRGQSSVDLFHLDGKQHRVGLSQKGRALKMFRPTADREEGGGSCCSKFAYSQT